MRGDFARPVRIPWQEQEPFAALPFGSQRPIHQFRNGLAGIAFFKQHGIDAAGDGHVHACFGGKFYHAGGCRHAFHHRFRRGQRFLNALALPHRLAKGAIPPHRRNAGGHQVAHSGQPDERFRPGAESQAQPGDFNQPAGQQGSLGVIAAPQTVQNARGDSDNVFDGPGKFHAHNVRVGIHPEIGTAEHLLHLLGQGFILGCYDNRGGMFAGNFGSDRRPREGRHASAYACAVQNIQHNLRRPKQRVIFDALGNRADGQSGRHMRLEFLPDASDKLRGHGGNRQRRPRHRLGGVTGNMNTLGQTRAGEKAFVFAMRIKLGHMLRKGRPQAHGQLVLRKHDCAERSHGTVADNGNMSPHWRPKVPF